MGGFSSSQSPFRHSCYLILSSSSSDISFQLEGVEDIDFIEQKDTNSNITHIQLKYSTNKQNASFLSSVLKNFLETYLLDQNRYFKLVYDFPVAEGHLDKLIASNLDENSRAYWVNVISDIQKKLPSWNWSAYDFDSFISHLSFEKVEKSTLADEIEKALMLNLTDAKSTLTKMQDSFSELTIDFDTSEWPSDFTAIETKSIEQLIMYCSYYQVHSPSKYFNKYQIKSWYDKQQQDNLTAVKTALSPLASICSVHFPFQSYVVGILRYYPIIVNNFDTVLKDNSAAFVLNCIEFAEAPFDYLVILSANNSNHINPIALQFSRQMFIDVKKAIRSNDSAALENITYPYPVNVTSSMLDCFIGNYNLLEKSPSAPDLSSIGDIAENLWIYSKSVELLSTPEDADYLASETQRLRTNITEMLQLSRDQLSKKDFDWLVDICNQVFSGKEFDDKLFNDIIEHFTSQAENC